MDGSEVHERERDLRRLAALRPIDDEFMRCMFRGETELAQWMLRLITGIEDLVLVDMETQRDVKRLAGARSVCLDVWGRDSAGRRYNIEVERSDAGASPRRARYHGAVMDVEALGVGRPFSELPETYVVFVTEGDPFGAGAGVYRFERRDERGAPLGDGLHVLYVNASWQGGGELGALVHDFLCSDPGEMLTRPMAERAAYLKSDPEGVGQMNEVLEEMRAEDVERGMREGMKKGMKEGMKEGMKKGMKEGVLRSAASLMETLGLTARQAMDALRVPEEDRPGYLARL